MIRFISGRLVAAGENEVIVENQGIGYAVYVPVSVLGELPAAGEEVKLFTYFYVREDAMQLFGFLTQEELSMFRLLITVNGIGPKAGLAILGSMRVEDIRYAVMSEDAKTIAKAPGVGPKTAKKVILELKDKIDLETLLPEGHSDMVQGENTVFPVTSEMEQTIQDAVEALVVLGYPRTDAAKAVHAVELTEGMTVEELLKKSLKHF